jgi:type I restriction enzyme, S subunit
VELELVRIGEYMNQNGALKTTNSQLKEGYKQTEVGVIPEDWDAFPISHFASVSSGGTPSRKIAAYWGGEIPWITTAQIDFNIINFCNEFIMEEGLKNSAAKIYNPGTLLMAMYGQGKTRGKVAITGITATVNQACAAISLSNSVSRLFIFHNLASRYQEIRELSNTGNQENLNGHLIKNIFVALPPTLLEQEAIACTLSDIDALIESLDRLLTKKRQIKQGAMQKLLRSKDEWVEKKLGKTATLKARIGWQGLTTAEYLDLGDFHLVTGTEFKNGFIDWDNCHFIEESRYKQDKNIQLKINDVLVTKDGTIGKVAIVDYLKNPATLNSGVFVIRPVDNAFCPRFFYYLLCSNLFNEFLSQLSAGSTINHLYQKDFINFVYQVPKTLEEQIEIANILSDMDAEIESISAKLTKTRQLKQGMMHELLTGRIRLVDL